MRRDADVIVYDLQEVGGSTWTYVSTMALAMQVAKKRGIPFVVLDRPNPIGGEIVEGALLDPKFKSFVGMYPIPARHGMTVGQLGLPWVNPSPISVRLRRCPVIRVRLLRGYDSHRRPRYRSVPAGQSAPDSLAQFARIRTHHRCT